eukprot:Nk52_evm93s914 gene=Nk52_evmTU93s914
MAKKERTNKPSASGRNGVSKSNNSMNPNRVREHVGMRDKATIERLKMYKSGGKAIRDKAGNVLKAAPFQSKVTPGTMARVAPNRKWFGNTRVVGQTELTNFREALGSKVNDTYSVLMRSSKIPMSLLTDPVKQARSHLLDTEKFENTFGPKAQRKKPTIKCSDMSEYASKAAGASETYDHAKDSNLVLEDDGWKKEVRDKCFDKGQSRRIWGELYKVIDSSDVILQVLDARDPMGTRSLHIEKYIKREKAHKHVVLILNKCDLVPTWVTQKWVKKLSAEYPTIAFHSSMTNPFGKGAVIQLLRQFSKLHTDKKQISVGLVGYPNVGKSSLINALEGKKVCNVAPIPGETKVWQYITLMRRIFLIDCPGVVHDTGDSETDIVLKGIVRLEKIEDAEAHIPAVLERVKKEYIVRTYGVQEWSDAADFLEKMAVKFGKLLKGGEPDVHIVARMVLTDWQRGKLPYFAVPTADHPEQTEKAEESEVQATSVEKDITVEQDLDKIAVDEEFLSADMKPEGSQDAEELEKKRDESKKVDWDDVFGSVVGEKVSEMPTKTESKDTGKQKMSKKRAREEDMEEDPRKSKKEKRKTTNKQKTGVHYYDTANVKNKNLAKKNGGKNLKNPSRR